MNSIKHLASFLLLLLAAITAHAQTPSKPIAVVVPFPAGGQADVVGRIVANALADALKQNVIVENVPGAGGLIGARKVIDAAPDGHALFLGSPSQLILAGMASPDVKIRSDDFRAIHMIGTSPYVIMARQDLPVQNAEELAEYARDAAKRGAPLTYASVGFGTVNHVLGEELATRVKAPLTHVPYKGGAEVMRDLVGGRVDLLINIYTSQQIALAQEGKFKFIAALSRARQPLLPNVPSVDEGHALKGFHAEIWSGLFVRKDTPATVIAHLNKGMAKALSEEALRKALLDKAGLRAAQPRTVLTEVEADYAERIEQFRRLAVNAGFK